MVRHATSYRALPFLAWLAVTTIVAADEVGHSQRGNIALVKAAPVPSIGLRSALEMLAASVNAATRSHILVSCVVVDVRGEEIAASRMDGSPSFILNIARGKAVGSALIGL